MYKASWGLKRICPMCRSNYYDLGRTVLECPNCGKEIEVVNLAKPRRGRKPGSLNAQINLSNNASSKPKEVSDTEIDIESVEDVDIESDNPDLEDDTVLIEDETEIDPSIESGIKSIKDKEE